MSRFSMFLRTGAATVVVFLLLCLVVSAAAANSESKVAVEKAIYFHNTQTGAVDAWIVDGFEVVDTVAIGQAPGPNWWVATVHDINDNGSSDILWQNAAGRLAVWVMDGFDIVEQMPYGDEFVNPSFELVDLHDMDGDGKADAIFQNLLWGNRNVWFMDGLARIDGRRFELAGVNWNIVGVNDMGGDGKTNVIFEHLSDGRRNYWTLDENLERIADESSEFERTGIAWSLVAVHDMTGNGYPDIILQHEDGRRNMWVMGGARGMEILQGENIGERDNTWNIVGAGTATFPHETPVFDVFPASDIWGTNWLPHADITITVDHGDEHQLFEVQADADGHFSLQFHDDSEIEPHDIKPGYLVTATDGVTTRTHRVRYVTITDYDLAGNHVFGEADPGSIIEVHLRAPGFEHIVLQVVADAEGLWSASFTEDDGFVSGNMVGAHIRDKLGNSTGFEIWMEEMAEVVHYIGALLPLTGGGMEDFAENSRLAAALAVTDVNDWLEAEGNQWRLGLKVDNTEVNGEVALEKLESRFNEGVSLFVGPMVSGEAHHVLDFANTNKILLVSPSSTNPALAIAGDWLYRFCYHDEIDAPEELLLGENSYHDHVKSHIQNILGREPDEYAYNSYDAVWAFALSIADVGYDSEAVRDALPDIVDQWSKDYGASGHIVLDENGDRIVPD